MLELICLFCGEQTLIVRHIDTKVYQVVCVSCGGAGPQACCHHEAKIKYQIVYLDDEI